MPRRLIVAIDGPAGAGKSAAARELAKKLGVLYVDTGAMYRAVALAALRRGVKFPLDGASQAEVVKIAEGLQLHLEASPSGTRVFCAGEDVSEALRAPEVSRAASQVAAIPGVRRAMVARQRELGQRAGGVLEGRDIGTVVFPDAALKVFLTARPEVRAQRRFDELRKRGVQVRWEDVLAEQRERDQRDTSRADSPLRPAAGAIILDTSDLTLPEVVQKLYELALSVPVPLDRLRPAQL